MSNKQETVETVAAEMRNESHAGDASCLEWVGAKMRTYADRFEAAAKREREATREKSSQVGNAAKLREACEALMSEIGGYLTDGLEVIWCSVSGKTINKARAALAAPPRNCDRPECATTKAAQDVWRKEDGGKTAYYEWLLAASTKSVQDSYCPMGKRDEDYR